MKKIISCVLSLLLLSPYAFCAEVGRVTYVEGRVDAAKAGSDLAVPLREGDEISVGDAIRTKAASKAEVSFNDKSTIRLAQNSRVEIRDYQIDDNKRKTATIKLDRGKVRTIIAKTAASAPFNILTPNSEGQVKGSDIFTFYQAGSSGMLVAEGNLALKSVAHPETSISIPAGNSAFIDIAGSASVPRPYLDLEKKMHEQDTYIPPSVPKMTETAVIKGVLSKVSGVVKITPKGASAPRDASINDILGEGDQIETGDNGMVEIKFDNNCGLNLKPNTQIKITRLVIDPKTGEYQNMFESSKGKIKARIENLKGKSTFEIKTPTAICGARGTLMYLEITPGMAKAFFEGGNGYINNLISGAQTDIGMGSNGSADNQGNNSDPAPTSNEERDNWTAGWDSGNDTSGYSSGDNDANDNLGNTGDNTGGNNGAGTGNNGGTNNDNGNPYVYIPPENTSPTPTPTPPTFLFGIFDTTDNSINLAATGNFWTGIGSVTGTIAGFFTNPNNYSLWHDNGDLVAATGDGTKILGGIGGTSVNGNLESLFYGIYIRPNGETGYIKLSDGTGNLIGSFDSLLGTFQASGMFTAYPRGTTTVSPDDLLYDSPFVNRGVISGNVGGDLSGTITGENFSIVEVPGERPAYWGVWRTESSGTYAAGSMSNSWKAVAGSRDESGYKDSYWITNIDGTSWSGGSLEGAIRGMMLSYGTTGPLSDDSLGIISGNILGTYGAGSWQALSCGTFDEAPLTFGGETTHESGVDYALFGGTEYLWEGSPGILFIGDYSAQQAPSRELWKFHTLGRTDDGGAIYGMAGGIKLDNVLKGLMYAIYVKLNPDYNPDDPNSHPYLTGYLESTDISGNVYPDISAAGMFEADGSVTATEMGETSIRPDQLNEESGFLKREAITGKVGGDLVGNLLNAHDESESVTLEDNAIYQSWAVFRIEASGTYQNAPSGTGWTAVAGDHDNYDDGREGYWIAHLTGADWSDGQFSGTMAGRDLTYDSESFQHDSSTGTFSGKYKGTYSSEDNSWSMVGLGFSDAEIPLAFGGETTHESGVDYALFGGTQSLWAGSPDTSHDILFMGDYSAQGAPQRDLWRFHTLGVTSDNAAIYGMVGGTKLNNVLKGLMYAIYIRPDPDPEGQYLTGYLRSTDISGNVYPDLGAAGMFEADGSVTATQMGQTAVSSTQLLSYMQNDTWNDRNAVIYRDEFSGKVGGNIAGTFSGESIGIDYSLTDQMWSIWRTEASGTYSPEPQGAWHAVIGGSDTESGDKGYFIGHINGPAWSGNEFSGDITGKDIWYSPSHFEVSSMGSMTGETVGTYANGTWSATNIGVTEEVSLTFGGEINITGDGFGYYDTVSKSIEMYHGSLSLLFGGTESLWTATPADPAQVTLIGEFANPDPDKYKLWGYNWVSGETADGAKYLGFLAGTNINNSLKGMSAFLYVRPDGDGYRAGYLRSNDISGNFYTDISMLYATGHYSSDLDVSTDVLPSQVFKDSLFIKETDTHDDDGIIGGDISGNSSVGGIKLVEPDGTSKPWSIWGISCGGTFTNTPADPNDWHAVIGGKSTDETTGDLTGYWLGDINGDSWSGDGSLSGSVNVTGIDDFTLGTGYHDFTTSEGNLLGFYETNPNTWQALGLGITTETLLTFGGESPSSQFGYYDQALETETFPSGELNYLFGGTGSLWDDTAKMTIIGEFSNPDGYKFWDNESALGGYTSDGARFYTGGHGFLCGITGSEAKDSSKALFYAFYIRPVLVPDPENPEQFITQHLAGYIKSTDLSGEFYSSIDMFTVDGSLVHKDFNTTTILPENLAANVKKTDSEAHSLVAGSGFSGTGAMDSYYIEGQGWGLFAGSSGGTYSALPTNGNMRVGGYSENASEEINAYFIGESSDNSWQGDENSGTTSGRMSGTTITNDNLEIFSGDSIGTYEAGNWQALNIGEWVATPLKFVSAISDGSVSLAGFFGSTESAWTGSPAGFTFIGNCSLPADGKYHLWGTDLRSYNYHDDSSTTYDGGAYRGGIGGIFKDNSIESGFIAIYVDNEGNAGTLYNLGNASGSMYPEIETFKIDGTLQVSQKAYLGGYISPADYLKNINDGGYFNELNLEGGGFESLYGGTISGGIARQDSTVFNILGQNWGIWLATVTGSFADLTQEPTSWRLGLGGDVYFTDGETVASYWLGTMDVSQAADGRLDGTYKGFLFSEADEPGFVKVQTVSGDIKGYVEVEEGTGTWQAGAAGEWVEVTDLLSEYAMFAANGLSELGNFVNVPVTEVYSNVLTGAGSITGGISLVNLNNDFLNFVINYWENNKWMADYNGQAGGIDITGQAGGTYTVPDPTGNGSFAGAGAGIDQDTLNTVTVAGDYGPDGTLSNVTADVTLYQN